MELASTAIAEPAQKVVVGAYFHISAVRSAVLVGNLVKGGRDSVESFLQTTRTTSVEVLVMPCCNTTCHDQVWLRPPYNECEIIITNIVPHSYLLNSNQALLAIVAKQVSLISNTFETDNEI